MGRVGAGQLFSVSALVKRFGPFVALNGANLSLSAGEIRALCGGNGAGKSTLVKILTGVMQPNEGTIAIEGRRVAIRNPVEAQRHGLALVAQELSLAPDLSIYDNLWLGHADAPFWRHSAETRVRARRALVEVGLELCDLDRPVRQLSLGERQLVEIARGLVREAKVLILDEPTATLSNNEIEKVFAAARSLKMQGRSIIFITHRLGEVFDLCDSVTVMRNGEVVVSADVHDVTREQLIEWMLGRRLEEIYPPARGVVRELVLDLAGLNIPGVIQDFSLSCRAGEIVGVVGQIGSGAIEAVRAMAGLDHRATGRMRVRGQTVPFGSAPRAAAAGVQFVSEDRAAEGVFLRLKAGANLTATRIGDHARWGLIDQRVLRTIASGLASTVGFDPRRLSSRADELSGGNQQKLAVGRCAGRAVGGVLLLNEPTRGVDMGARAEIYKLLRRFCDEGYAVVLASTDMEEVLGLADRIVTMYRGRSVRVHAHGAFEEAALLADITHPAAAA
jgi:ABC-type sugar transport system ATPase subunit